MQFVKDFDHWPTILGGGGGLMAKILGGGGQKILWPSPAPPPVPPPLLSRLLHVSYVLHIFGQDLFAVPYNCVTP